MTRIIRVETCDRCPYVAGSRGCRHPDALVEVAGVPTTRMFDDYFVIPAWCPLEQDGPDWRPYAATFARGDSDEDR
jgi:hypothetical protein